MCSVTANLLGTIIIFAFPSFWGFAVAAFFAALYWAFWSGTGQAFLAENLSHAGREKEFGKVIGGFMFYGELATLITPLLASLILFHWGDSGYKILAGLDVFFAVLLIFLTKELKSVEIKKKIQSVKSFFIENINTAKVALGNVFLNPRLRFFTLYRSLGSGVTFLGIVILPTLAMAGMIDYWSGIIIAGATVFSMFASKYAYIFADKWGYRKVWVLSSGIQAIVLIGASFYTSNWILLAIIFGIYQFFLGISNPVWNHILVEETKGAALATTRSIVAGFFFLYITVGKQFLSTFPIETALFGLGVFMLIMNLLLGRKIVFSDLEKNA
jgi:MFS family permease